MGEKNRKKIVNGHFEATEFNNIKEIIENSVKEYGDKNAFIIKNKNKEKIGITYREMYDDINAFATSLYNIGMQGKRVAIIGKNRYEWVVAHLANLFGGIVSVPLDKDLQLEELENSLYRSKADAIVFDSKLLKLVLEIKKRRNTILKEYIAMDTLETITDVAENSDEKDIKELKFMPQMIKDGKKEENINKEYLDYKIKENEMGILLFTSGTTSQSKAVMLTQKGVASNIYSLHMEEDIMSSDVNIAFLPFHHIFGSTCMVVMLDHGVTTCFPDGLRYIKQNLKEYKVSVFVGVPVLVEAIYKAIVKEIAKQNKTKLVNNVKKMANFLLKLKIDIRRKLFKSVLEQLGGDLRLIVCGGAPTDPEIIKGFDDFGIITVQGYGLTETSPVVAAESYFSRKPGSVGKAMKTVEIEIVNKDSDGIGEVRCKGPGIMLGYYEMPEKTEEVLKDGWFYTGDLGYMDKDGYLFLTGRSKNLIVLKNGKKVFPEEIEAVVNRLDLVSECMVFGLEDKEDKLDVKLSIKVVYNEEEIKEKYSNLSEEELEKTLWNMIKKVNEGFPRYKHIQNMIATHTELIKTTTKKIKRNEELKLIYDKMDS